MIPRVFMVIAISLIIQPAQAKEVNELYYPSGNMWQSVEMEPNGENGKIVRYLHDGVVEAEGRMQKGLPTGQWTFYHSKHKKAAQGHYDQGRRKGLWTFWDKKSGQSSQVTYRLQPLHSIKMMDSNKYAALGFHIEMADHFIFATQWYFVEHEQMKRRVLDQAWPLFNHYFGFKERTQTPVTIVAFFSQDYMKRGLAKLGVTSTLGKMEFTQGFYRPPTRTLYIGIMSGDGQIRSGYLLHELIHTKLHDDFPDIPIWLDEGIADLFTNVALGKHFIEPLPYHRLSYVRERLDTDMELSIEEVLELTVQEFRHASEIDSLMVYGMARYLCMYLHARGQLKACYQLVKANMKKDPTGTSSLLEITGLSGLADLDQAVKEYINSIDLVQYNERTGTEWTLN